SLNNRLVALDTVRSFSCDEAPNGGDVCIQRTRVWCPEPSYGGPARSRASSPGEKAPQGFRLPNSNFLTFTSGNYRSEGRHVADGEVGDAPALAAGLQVCGDLVVGA